MIPGDVTALADNEGNVGRSYDYDPFGTQIGHSSDDENPYRYSGEYYDVENGYTYLRARYYDPSIGRFISEDPALDGDNWYAYCGNDPVNYEDPTGMWNTKTHKKLAKKASKKLAKEVKKAVKKAEKDKKKAEKKGKKAGNVAAKELLKGSVYQDVQRKNKAKYAASGYHGGDGYEKTIDSYLEKARAKWKNGKYKKAALLLGIAMHTAHDFYAHNVKVDGKYAPVGTYMGIVDKDKYGIEEFTKAYSSKGAPGHGIDLKDMIPHYLFADNEYADFKDGKWTYIENPSKNQRYIDSMWSSSSILSRFLKKIGR